MGRSKDENVELRRKWRLFLVLKQLKKTKVSKFREILRKSQPNF